MKALSRKILYLKAVSAEAARRSKAICLLVGLVLTVWPLSPFVKANGGDDHSVGNGQANAGTETFFITVTAERTAFGVHLDGEELRSSDNWFHLAPGDQRVLSVRRPRAPTNPEPEIEQRFPNIVVRALNSRSSARVTWQ